MQTIDVQLCWILTAFPWELSCVIVVSFSELYKSCNLNIYKWQFLVIPCITDPTELLGVGYFWCAPQAPQLKSLKYLFCTFFFSILENSVNIIDSIS